MSEFIAVILMPIERAIRQ